MRCAIYARKSTDDNGIESDLKSVARQVEHARRLAAERGWTVAEEHIYVDDGISGAKFKHRPGLQALIERGLSSRAFEALIMMESSRLGGDMAFVPYFKTLILDAGIRVFYYLNGEEEPYETPEDELISIIKSYADRQERLATRARVRDALYQRAQRGFAASQPPYRYRTERVPSPAGGRGHAEYELIPEEAAVIRRIYRDYVDGISLFSLARALAQDLAHLREILRGSVLQARQILRKILDGRFSSSRSRWTTVINADGSMSSKASSALGGSCGSGPRPLVKRLRKPSPFGKILLYPAHPPGRGLSPAGPC